LLPRKTYGETEKRERDGLQEGKGEISMKKGKDVGRSFTKVTRLGGEATMESDEKPGDNYPYKQWRGIRNARIE